MGPNTQTQPAPKRRRVLSEIDNTELSVSENRRKTVSSRSAEIPAKNERDSTEPSDIENVPGARPAALSDMNTKGSGIPTLKKSDRIERFLTINESLNRKSTVNGYSEDFLAALERAEKQNSQVNLEKLEHESRELDRELEQARKKLLYSEEEAFELRKLHRALQTEHRTLQMAVEESRGKLAYFSGQVIARAEKKEREIQHQILEYENEASRTYDSVRVQVKAELEKALRSEDAETAKELELLEEQKKELQQKLRKVAQENEQILQQQQQIYDDEYGAISQETSSQIAEAQQKLHALITDHDSVENENQDLKNAISCQEHANQRTKDEITHLEREIQNHNSQKEALQAQLQYETARLKGCEVNARQSAEKEAAARHLYEEERKKYDLYIATRRRLEHAISKIGDKNRVLVRAKKADPKAVESFGFDRIEIYGQDPEYSRNWEAIVQEALIGCRITLVFSGSGQDMRSQILDIFSFLRSGLSRLGDRESTFYYQSICVQNGRPSDSLNSSSEVEISSKEGRVRVSSQKMVVKNASDIANTFQNRAHRPGVYVHVFTVEGVNSSSESVSGTVTLIDISSLSMQEQSDTLRYSRSDILEILFHNQLSYTNVDICDVEDIEDPMAQELLAVLNSRTC